MILKSSDLKKINFKQNKILLFYGKNEGLKEQAVKEITKNKENIFTYEEKEILDNQNNFFECALTRSLFEQDRNIIIKRASDKILNVIEEICLKELDNIKILIIAENLEKKSKLRSFFEKKKDLVSIAFYPDNELTLSKLTYSFFRERNISISQSNINHIVTKSLGDRKSLQNELEKIENFCKKGKKLNFDNISKIINLSENYSISELVNNCLAKNRKKIIDILNENNYTNDDGIIITRTFLSRSKKILSLSEKFEENRDINLTISTAKPPIFWKDRDITIQQIYEWKPEKIKKLIYKLNELELIIKRNINNSINIVSNFIFEQSA